jgi:Na+/H+-translocating membrane pyrophosphatase
MIMALIFGATIKINTLLISKSLTKILLIIASILSMFMIILLPIHYFVGTLTWGIFILILLTIAIFFLIAHLFPKLPIVSYLREIHLSNLEDAERQELREP